MSDIATLVQQLQSMQPLTPTATELDILRRNSEVQRIRALLDALREEAEAKARAERHARFMKAMNARRVEELPEPSGEEPAPAMPPAPAPATPPDTLDPVNLAWYLGELTPEFQAHGREVSLQSAQEHWVMYGRPQGRKWKPDAPPPAWGPRAEDAPPGVPL